MRERVSLLSTFELDTIFVTFQTLANDIFGLTTLPFRGSPPARQNRHLRLYNGHWRSPSPADCQISELILAHFHCYSSYCNVDNMFAWIIIITIVSCALAPPSSSTTGLIVHHYLHSCCTELYCTLLSLALSLSPSPSLSLSLSPLPHCTCMSSCCGY